jgi:hypothetical protein
MMKISDILGDGKTFMRPGSRTVRSRGFSQCIEIRLSEILVSMHVNREAGHPELLQLWP